MPDPVTPTTRAFALDDDKLGQQINQAWYLALFIADSLDADEGRDNTEALALVAQHLGHRLEALREMRLDEIAAPVEAPAAGTRRTRARRARRPKP